MDIKLDTRIEHSLTYCLIVLVEFLRSGYEFLMSVNGAPYGTNSG